MTRPVPPNRYWRHGAQARCEGKSGNQAVKTSGATTRDNERMVVEGWRDMHTYLGCEAIVTAHRNALKGPQSEPLE